MAMTDSKLTVQAFDFNGPMFSTLRKAKGQQFFDPIDSDQKIKRSVVVQAAKESSIVQEKVDAMDSYVDDMKVVDIFDEADNSNISA